MYDLLKNILLNPRFKYFLKNIDLSIFFNLLFIQTYFLEIHDLYFFKYTIYLFIFFFNSTIY